MHTRHENIFKNINLILKLLIQAAMDTQEGEGQQPTDPQPADPAVEEQGMEH